LTQKVHKIFLSAGELSGDIHGAALISKAKESKFQNYNFEFFGLGGKEMELRGFRLIHTIDETAVMGFTEIIGSIAKILKVRRDLVKAIHKERPSAVVLMDSPDLNFHLAKVATSLNIPVIYYICPQIWAWRAGRIKFLEKYTSRRALIFPFEKAYYQNRGVSSDLVGHPLFDEICLPSKNELRKTLGLLEDKPVLAIFPGSRKGMFMALSPVMFETAEKLLDIFPDIQIAMSISPIIDHSLCDNALSLYPKLKKRGLILRSKSRELLGASDAALLTSGTSVMEATIIGTPMIVAYKVSALSWFLAKSLVKVPFAAITNIIAGRRIVGEYLQDDCSPEKLTKALIPLLFDSPERRLLLYELEKVRVSMGGPGASLRVLEIIVEEMEKNKAIGIEAKELSKDIDKGQDKEAGI
jgi:lipid-A-disaccharide synthase